MTDRVFQRPTRVQRATRGQWANQGVGRAEPGIKSYLDLPLVAGRAAPELSRSAK